MDVTDVFNPQMGLRVKVREVKKWTHLCLTTNYKTHKIVSSFDTVNPLTWHVSYQRIYYGEAWVWEGWGTHILPQPVQWAHVILPVKHIPELIIMELAKSHRAAWANKEVKHGDRFENWVILSKPTTYAESRAWITLKHVHFIWQPYLPMSEAQHSTKYEKTTKLGRGKARTTVLGKNVNSKYWSARVRLKQDARRARAARKSLNLYQRWLPCSDALSAKYRSKQRKYKEKTCNR